MDGIKERHKVAIIKFQKLLRSGKDYSVKYMYDEVGKVVYMQERAVQRIINYYYQEVITKEMIDFLHSLNCDRKKEIEVFAQEFNVCTRESILLIRYIRRNGTDK